ncbi:MAG: alpha/beta fold hydrolase, partial [Actinomycetia bacterium]|nr:alpha/beta fold hydrolase [Actinomycetes bacterium]
AIAFDEVARNAIMMDNNWNNGNYYNKEKKPDKGLGTARMIGHITYLSDEKMREKFGRRLQNSSDYSYNFMTEFEVESYLAHQGRRFVERFDANSLLYLSKAMDYFDVPFKYGSLEKAFENITSKILVTSFTSDWLFPPYHSVELVRAFLKKKIAVSYLNMVSVCGHDAFLIEHQKLTPVIRGFLSNV